MPGIGTFISAGRSLPRAVERVRPAELPGHDPAFFAGIAGRAALEAGAGPI